METVITFILAGVVAFAVIMYVILDGFDLGIGIIFPWVQKQTNRDTMVATILPVWDGNETWLVLGGATLYGAFPIAYSTLLPTLYLPLILMLASLIFRGVSFEFMHNSHKSKPLWVFAFSLGSTLAAFCQGVVLGTFVQGYTYANGEIISSGAYSWLTPFSMITGFAVVCGYALLGATWLVAKTTGEIQDAMIHRAKVLLLAIGILMVVVSLWTPFIDPYVKQLWFTLPSFFYLLPLPVLTLLAFIAAWRGLQKRHDYKPFCYCVALFLLAYVGFAVSVWPYIIPRAVTIWDAAAPLKSQIFVLVGLAILLPVLVAYTIYSYVVFRGKVTSSAEVGIHY